MKSSIQVYDGDGRKTPILKRVNYYYHCGLINDIGQTLMQGTFSSLEECLAHLATIAADGPTDGSELLPKAKKVLRHARCEIVRLRNNTDGCAQLYVVKNRTPEHPTTV